ncbi:cysteine hydrolase family protein [Aureibacillus halotolerans]|uniref:Nicotinamidase-related amidase n=1 Tax=Aureibacillus halotolerans TaxID=1508390 RepID=A0A4R6TWV5_9BACI|nr:isochorismatase family cysteine hydrolase [Aureibacillus halotolerans]TDQ36753.1 nicotinamidase-related amidase [Aureibacillus halotolerans]
MPTNKSNIIDPKDKKNVALLIIDVINDFEFEGGESLEAQMPDFIENLLAIRDAATKMQLPVIYVNDNFGKWQSDFHQLTQQILKGNSPGQPMVEALQPRENDYIVVKPKQSGFYSTPLDMLLSHLAVDTLILTGLTGDQCILFTAMDAYMRDFRLYVPDDCIITIDETIHKNAMDMIKTNLKADVSYSKDLPFWSPH